MERTISKERWNKLIIFKQLIDKEEKLGSEGEYLVREN
jgi:hypothetical protein